MFRNDKGDNDKRPDYRGDLNVNGVTYEIAGWIKSGQKGKFMSLSVKPKDEQQAQAPAKQQQRGGNDFDDVPFRQMAAGRAFLAM